jgi:hypothetical protein
MSLNNPIETIKKGGLLSPDIGQTILGNIPSIPIISPRNYFLQTMESWISTPSNTTQWVVLFDDFPQTLKQQTLQELEYTDGAKQGWNIPYTQLTNYFLQKTTGCIFCQGFSLPRERANISYANSNRGFIGGPVVNERATKQNLTLDFLETNLSFVDAILRPWVILASHKGLVARPDGESIKTNITVIQYAKTNQNLSPIPRKIWTFYDVCPVAINQTNYNYADESVEIRAGVEFSYNRYQVYNSTYIPVFSLIDKFSNGGVDELADTILLDDSVKNLENLF